MKSVLKPDLLARLRGIRPTVLSASTQLQLAVQSTSTHAIAPTAVVGNVNKAEMMNLYSYHMVQRKPGRSMYEELASGAGDVCPLCGHRSVTTLDHYMPKAKFPIFSVTPLNLVPSCTDCNFARRNQPTPAGPEDESLHPYFDNVENDRWLFATVHPFQGSVGVSFEIHAPSSWTPVLVARTERHFAGLGVRKLYMIQAQQELANVRLHLVNILKQRGPTAVSADVAATAESRRAAHLNSWQTALYEAMATDTWFCAKGVLLIPEPKKLARGAA